MNNSQQPNPALTTKIMDEIKREHIQIKPRTYFVMGSALIAAGTLLLIVMSVVTTHLVIYKWRGTNPFGYLDFGWDGIVPVIQLIPWIPILIAVTTTVVGLKLIQRYDFSYKTNFIGISGAVILAVLTSGYVLDELNLNQTLGKFKPMQNFYQSDFTANDWVMGEVLEHDADNLTLILITPNNELVSVTWDKRTRFPRGLDFEHNPHIRAIGEWIEEGIKFHAVGIGTGHMHWSITPPASPPQIRGFRNR